ncbi:MAG: hypothetical protein RCG15_01805 [Candidatus Rickettsia vulgarisii]
MKSNEPVNYIYRRHFIETKKELIEDDKIKNIITEVLRYVQTLDKSSDKAKNLIKVKDIYYKNKQYYKSSEDLIIDLIKADNNIIRLIKQGYHVSVLNIFHRTKKRIILTRLSTKLVYIQHQ